MFPLTSSARISFIWQNSRGALWGLSMFLWSSRWKQLLRYVDKTLDHLRKQLVCFFDSPSCSAPSSLANIGKRFEHPSGIFWFFHDVWQLTFFQSSRMTMTAERPSTRLKGKKMHLLPTIFCLMQATIPTLPFRNVVLNIYGILLLICESKIFSKLFISVCFGK